MLTTFVSNQKELGMPGFNDYASLKAEGASAGVPVVIPNVQDPTPPADTPPDPANPTDTSTLSNAMREALGLKPTQNINTAPSTHTTPSGNTPPETTTNDDVTGEPGGSTVVTEPGTTATPGLTPDGTRPPAPSAPPADAPDAQAAALQAAEQQLLKTLGFDSIDALKEKLAPPAELSPEEKKRKEDVLKAAVQHYAVDQLGYDPAVFHTLETYRGASDHDIVFEQFKQGFAEAVKDNPEYTGKNIEEEARFEFENLFHLNSDNALRADMGKRLIAQSAAEMRSALENKYATAQADYLQVEQQRAQIAPFKQTLESVLKNVPKQIEWAAEDGGKVVFQLDKLNKEELRAFLVNDTNFKYFLKHGGKDATSYLNKQVDNFIALKHKDDMVKAAIKTSYDLGMKKAVVGAKATFQGPQLLRPESVDPSQLTPADDARVAAILGQRRL